MPAKYQNFVKNSTLHRVAAELPENLTVTDSHKFLAIACLIYESKDRFCPPKRQVSDRVDKFIRRMDEVPYGDSEVEIKARKSSEAVPKRNLKKRLWEHPADLTYLQSDFIDACRFWANGAMVEKHSFSFLVAQSCSLPADVKAAVEFADRQQQAYTCLRVRFFLCFSLYVWLWPQWLSRVYRRAKTINTPWKKKSDSQDRWVDGCDFLQGWCTLQSETIIENLRSGERRIMLMLASARPPWNSCSR